jgi:hypothetical protein
MLTTGCRGCKVKLTLAQPTAANREIAREVI